MEAKDTIMDTSEATWAYEGARQAYQDECEANEKYCSPVKADNAGIDSHSLAQAEISYKAGIREVVEWFMDNYPEVCDSHLEAKLKDWGL